MYTQKPMDRADQLRMCLKMYPLLNLEFQALLSKYYRKCRINLKPEDLKIPELSQPVEQEENIEKARYVLKTDADVKADWDRTLSEFFRKHNIEMHEQDLKRIQIVLPPEREDNVEAFRFALKSAPQTRAAFLKAISELFEDYGLQIDRGLLENLTVLSKDERKPPQPSQP